MIEREKETDANFYSRKKFYEKSSQLDVERLKSLQKFEENLVKGIKCKIIRCMVDGELAYEYYLQNIEQTYIGKYDLRSAKGITINHGLGDI